MRKVKYSSWIIIGELWGLKNDWIIKFVNLDICDEEVMLNIEEQFFKKKERKQ